MRNHDLVSNGFLSLIVTVLVLLCSSWLVLACDAVRKKSANGYRRPSRGSPPQRGFVGLLLTAGICIAAFAL